MTHEQDLGCEICAACGHVCTETVLHSAVEWTTDGATGTFLHDDNGGGGHLAAARVGLAVGDGGRNVARQMFRDVTSQHLENLNRSVTYAVLQLKLSKDAAAAWPHR